MVKYTAFSFFAQRFCPIISRSLQGVTGHWLLQPVRESNLQLFALIAIWISSKIHDSLPFTVRKLKSLADKTIHEQHYTTRDFAEAEVIFMQVLKFEIGTSDITFRFFEDLLIQLKCVPIYLFRTFMFNFLCFNLIALHYFSFCEFREVATIGDHLDLEVCMDIMDLLYEKEETTTLYDSPQSLAASILVASYVISVPKQRWEFPLIPWVKYGMACKEEEIIQVVTYILKHVLQPSSSC
ncbi:cyclin-J18-like isoform X2 [Bidens hawaiensis]